MTNSTRPFLFVLGLLVLSACQTEAPEAEASADAPPSTDIWLFSISDEGVALKARVTDWAGYDNQPMFSPDGQTILFTSERAGRANTHAYDIASGAITQLTFTEADKYSPTPIPGTKGGQFSVVHTDSAAFQGLWRYTVDKSTEPAPLVEVDAVAYYTWVGADDVLFWRLGSPNTLQLINVPSADTTVVAEGSVFSLHPVPGEEASVYFFSDGEDLAKIMRFDWKTHESTPMAPSLEGGRYFCVTPNGDLLMLDGDKLMSFTPGSSSEWMLLAELGISGGSRPAVSPDGTLLAVVGERPPSASAK